MRGPKVACVAIACFAAAPLARGADRWSLEIFGGNAYNFSTPLVVRQSGAPDIDLNARYATRPWSGAPYYAYRLGRWAGGRVWELEVVHHKLYLTRPPDTIQRFEITHGFNLVSLSRAWLWRGVIWRLGAGVVIAHPETTVRGKSLSGQGGNLGRGFSLAGPVVQVAIGRRFALSPRLFVALEGKVTAAHASVRVRDGTASVPNRAIHGLFGIGYAF